MKSKIFLTCLCLTTSTVSLAEEIQPVGSSSESQTQVNYQLQKVLEQTAALQKQVQELNAQVRQLKREKVVAQHKVRAAKVSMPAPAPKRILVSEPTAVPSPPPPELAPGEVELPPPQWSAQPPVQQTGTTPVPVQPEGNRTIRNNKPAPIPEHLQGSRYTGGVTVTTSPYLGLRSVYDASDLIVNLPTMNEDLRLLRERQELDSQLKERDLAPVALNRAVIQLSGGLEAQSFYQAPYVGGSHSDIDLTAAKFDILMMVSPYVTGLMSLRYDNTPPDTALQVVGSRVSNSRIFLKRGFITIGNLNESPIYFSAGQMFAPYGRYSNNILSSPPTLVEGQTDQRIALLGLSHAGLYAEAYTFKGDSHTGDTNHTINQGGGNLGYKYQSEVLNAELGGGYIANIADSAGFQDTGGPAGSFQGFATRDSSEMLAHTVPGMNVHGSMGVGKFGFETEYIGSLRAFQADNLSFDGHGAKPRSWYAEGDYQLKVFTKPSVFSVAFGRTWDALALALPQSSIIGAFNISIWRDTIETLEYRHDVNYPVVDTSGGNGVPITNSQGSRQNIVTAQLGIYF